MAFNIMKHILNKRRGRLIEKIRYIFSRTNCSAVFAYKERQNFIYQQDNRSRTESVCPFHSPRQSLENLYYTIAIEYGARKWNLNTLNHHDCFCK